MRALPLTMAALALSAFTGLADAAPRAWFFEVSAARAFGGQWWYEDVGHRADDGAALNATVGRRALPWLAVTGDVGVLRVDEVLLVISFPEDTWTVDRATHATFMTSVRLEPTNDSSLAPSLEIGAGLGWLHWGDRHVASMLPGGDRTVAGDQQVAWGWSTGLRLGFATRSRVSPQAIGRVHVFYEQEGPFLVSTLGFGLRY
jgi:hypothetical protein